MTVRDDHWLIIVQFWTTLIITHLFLAGIEQGGRPERGRTLLEPISRKRRMTSATAA